MSASVVARTATTLRGNGRWTSPATISSVRVWKTFRSTRSPVFDTPRPPINVCAAMSCESRAPWPDSV
jgi:hypothetical protein